MVDLLGDSDAGLHDGDGGHPRHRLQAEALLVGYRHCNNTDKLSIYKVNIFIPLTNLFLFIFSQGKPLGDKVVVGL